MALWRPDPTFYPSARLAMEAPQERLAYVAVLNPGSGEPDAMTVVDCDPNSGSYSQVVHSLEMPNVGDELHHFNWNACSAALCPSSAHPHLERRYLVVPSLANSRIYIIDTQPDPERPRIVKTIEAEQVHRAGYSRPHTVHCGPDAIYVSALGSAEGDRPGGIMLLDHYTFEPIGPWELDRGPQELAYDFWWHIGIDTMMTSEWGTPEMFESGARLEDVVGPELRSRPALLGYAPPRSPPGSRPGSAASDGPGAAPGTQPDPALWLLRSGREHRGPVGLNLPVAPRRRPVGRDQGDFHPGRTCRRLGVATGVAAIGRGTSPDYRHRPVAGRPFPLHLVLGYRQAAAVRRFGPLQPQADRRVGNGVASSARLPIPTEPP